MTGRTPRIVRVRVPCSTSNLGAGFDCMGLALDRHLTASFEQDGEPFRLVRLGTLEVLSGPPESDLLAKSFLERARARGTQPAGVLRVTSEIPVARGLGSSAAAVVAGLALADALAGEALDRSDLLRSAVAREGHADNVAPATFGGLMGVWPGPADAPDEFIAKRLVLSPKIGFAFAAPGVAVETAAARAALPSGVPHVVATRALARVIALIQGLAEGDPASLRTGFEDELHVPHRSKLIPRAAQAFAAAREAGAWAVTISGSGSGLLAVGAAGAEAAIAAAMTGAFGGPVADAIGFPLQPDLRGTVLEDET